MRLTIAAAVLILPLAPALASAGDLPRAYFAASTPGSWARYETTLSPGGKNRATYTRLADEEGSFVVEVTTEFLEGPAAGASSTSLFTLARDFDWKRRFLSFGKGLTAVTFVMAGSPPMPQPADRVTMMRNAMPDFTGGMEAAGTASHGGVPCDVFDFRAVLAGPSPATMTGKVCLNASVPFGLVHESATMRNESSGESSFETMLVASGTGAVRALPAQPAVSTPPVPPSPEAKVQRLNIVLAYQRGAIALDFSVPPKGRGRILEVALTNLGDQPLVVGLGSSTYAFEVGPPIGTLFFRPVEAQDIHLAPGETSPKFRAAQDEPRGVREGAFRLVMVRGVPTLTGNVKVGRVE